MASADIFLFRPVDSKAAYHFPAEANGRLHLEGIIPGDYILQIASGSFGEARRIRIVSGENNLGTFQLRPNMCMQHGVFCHTYQASATCLPCRPTGQVLQDDEGSPTVIDYTELQRRALHAAVPKWPERTPPPRDLMVHVVISASGRVLCAAVEDSPTAWDIAAINAARKWVFLPVLQRGRRVAAHGVIVFERDPKTKEK